MGPANAFFVAGPGPGPNFGPMALVLCPMAYVLRPMSYVLFPVSYVLWPVPYVLCPMSCVLCPMFYGPSNSSYAQGGCKVDVGGLMRRDADVMR